LIDGNRDRRLALFDHRAHTERLGKTEACAKCHHGQLPFHQHTACYRCHRDMYAETDIFDHSSHIRLLDENDGCVRCHDELQEEKTRETAAACETCHSDMLIEGATISRPETGTTGLAPGYMDAMHGLCVECHEDPDKEASEPAEYLSSCTTCHREILPTELRLDEPLGVTLPRSPMSDPVAR
jgi:hypothetical protein